MRKLFFLLSMTLLSTHLFSQIDKEFYFVGPEASSNHGDRPVYLRISTMEDTAHITLRLPANLNFTPIYKTINPNTTFSIQLDVIGGNNTWLDSIENRPPDQVLKKGILLTSDKLITSYYEIANGNNPAIFPLKGKNALGTEFYISGQNNYPNQTNDGSEAFDIVASEDNTLVTITPTLDIVGHAANVPFQILLNKGQTYSARTLNTTATASLMGSHVVSDKPIAITISDDSIITGGWDIIGDQIIPINLLGWDYIVIKGFADNVPPNNDDERIYILATKDNTDIFLDGNPTPVANLNTGQQYNYGIPAASNTTLIKSSKPVYVYHLSGHPGEAGASLLPQDSCTGSKKIGFNRSSTYAFALLILTRNGNQDSFYLNGSNSIITGANFTVVPGSGNSWVYYRQNNLSLAQVPQGANLLENTMGKFHLGIINNVSASSEYGYFSDFSTLYLGADASICPTDSMVLDGGPYRTSYEWKKLTGGIWITIGSSRYYTAHDTGFIACETDGDFCTLYDTIHIAYYPNGTVNLGNDRTICQGTTTTFDPGPYVTYQWSTGSTNRLLTTGAGGQYWVRVTNNNDCIAFDTVMLFIDSLPQTNHAITGPTTVCQGQSSVNYSIPVLPFATSYQWTLPPGATGSSSSNNITLNFTNLAVSGSLKVHGHNACGNGQDTALVIIVYPIPDVLFSPSTPSICSGQQTNIGLGSNVSGSTFSWTATATSPTVTGYSDGSGNLIAQTLTTPGIQVESVTYHITPTANGCIAPVIDYTVIINPKPHLTNQPMAHTICSEQTTNINLAASCLNATFTWTATLFSGNVTGFSNGSGPVIAQTLTNLLTTTGQVQYTITPVAGSCIGNDTNYLVDVKPMPHLTNNPPAKQICNNTNTNVTLNFDVTGTLFTWTASGSSIQVTGYSDNSIPTTLLNQTLVNSGFTTETVTYHITPHANGCDGLLTDYVVTVYPVPDVYFTPPSQTICPLQTSNITNNSHVSGATYTWTATGSSLLVSGFSSGSGNQIQQTLNSTSFNIETATYHVSPTKNGCPGINNNVVVTVDPAPVVFLTLCVDPVTTTDAQPIKLKGGNPVNGTYSGRGVNSAIFYPALAGAGMDTIYYSYTNNFGCSRNNYIVLSVISPIPFICSNTLTDPRDNKQYPTVQIGTQCWMAANLDYGLRVPGTNHQRDNCTPEKYCYNDNPGNCATSGGLYQWDELMQYNDLPAVQGLCPPAWHLPSETEWTTLFDHYISNGFAGSPLKYTGYSGFNAFLSGIRGANKSWSFDGFATFIWSSTAIGNNKAWAHGMNDTDPSVSYYPGAKSNGFSVRCLKD